MTQNTNEDKADAVERAKGTLEEVEPTSYDPWKDKADLDRQDMQHAIRRLQDTGQLVSEADKYGARFYSLRNTPDQ